MVINLKRLVSQHTGSQVSSFARVCFDETLIDLKFLFDASDTGEVTHRSSPLGGAVGSLHTFLTLERCSVDDLRPFLSE